MNELKVNKSAQCWDRDESGPARSGVKVPPKAEAPDGPGLGCSIALVVLLLIVLNPITFIGGAWMAGRVLVDQIDRAETQVEAR